MQRQAFALFIHALNRCLTSTCCISSPVLVLWAYVSEGTHTDIKGVTAQEADRRENINQHNFLKELCSILEGDKFYFKFEK
jgi:hypothetical protein